MCTICEICDCWRVDTDGRGSERFSFFEVEGFRERFSFACVRVGWVEAHAGDFSFLRSAKYANRNSEAGSDSSSGFTGRQKHGTPFIFLKLPSRSSSAISLSKYACHRRMRLGRRIPTFIGGVMYIFAYTYDASFGFMTVHAKCHVVPPVGLPVAPGNVTSKQSEKSKCILKPFLPTAPGSRARSRRRRSIFFEFVEFELRAQPSTRYESRDSLSFGIF
ncbi:uncharacterized protein FOMMEDRAFT_155892 [Fomitiporia mediterranea MF3/22]|uniref:uncharacterized protein n=1 Tax=Fomitiporia mediterranea (strain MF3/22) TaxID=694068 RepID=UPI0004408D50|nr:uncharacterized protein FOMMEDRAFT_155892 [Fomitiporia mediterranea MF3/22]EJD02585.1 hypothetical protein FOMMEDRAFT_155892 [Fomitiporia mediterranea MF3/22]